MDERRSTYFIDVDGVVIKHLNKDSIEQWREANYQLNAGVLDMFNDLHSCGASVVLVTARPESNRPVLERFFQQKGIAFDHLIMGIGNGSRYLINDKHPSGRFKTEAIEIRRNDLNLVEAHLAPKGENR